MKPAYPFHFRDGVLVDANGKPVPTLPQAKKGPLARWVGGEGKMRKKPNPRMITSDFDPKDQDE